jgi:protein-S-isoprenylcysteine O-methyltransferase Ste14
MKRNDHTPLIMWFVLLTGIILLAFIRLSRMIGAGSESFVCFDGIFIGLYVLWMTIEFRVSKKDVNTEGKNTADFMTCQLYGFGQALTILTALWFPSTWQTPNLANFIGIGIFLLGGCYRLWAIRTLGQFYSHRVRTIEQHQIVVSGPYHFTRHPAYGGMIIANAGICIYFFNWVTLCMFLFILLPAIYLRIVIEERMLSKIKGYPEFANKRKRLFPAVW